ncbi:MAG: leucine-rich repeat domain-containing protein, partial [Acutalibacteraceae bacterium]
MKQKNHLCKRILACVMVVIMTLTAVPLSGFAGIELKNALLTTTQASSPVSVENTTYGVLDPDVSAKKITLNDDFYFVSHQIDYENLQGNRKSNDQYGEGYAIVAQYNKKGYYLVGIHGLVKYFSSSEVPKLSLIDKYSQDFPYAIYEVYNPDTEKYDIYNASNGEYYEYGLDDICYDDTNVLRESEYCKKLTVIEKDGKYGIMDNKGVVLYAPEFSEISGYKNCILGTVIKRYTDEYGDSSYDYSYAILSNDGKSSPKQLYKALGAYDGVICAVSMDEKNYAAISVKNLSVLTDYKYDFGIYNSNQDVSSLNRVKYQGHYYIVGHYKEAYTVDGEEIECDRQDIICDDDTIWRVCEKFHGIKSYCEAYDNTLKISVATGYHYDRYGIRILDYTKYLVTPDGKNINYITTDGTSERYIYFRGRYGDLELREQKDSNKYYYLVDSEDNIIAENISKLNVVGNYLLLYTKTGHCVYDLKKGDFVLQNSCISFVDRSASESVLIVSESTDSGKFGLLNLNTGEFSGYIFNGYDCSAETITNGSRKLWKCSFSTDKYNHNSDECYINDKFKIIQKDFYDITVFGSNLLLDVGSAKNEYYSYEKRKIIDFDGNTVAEFNALSKFYTSDFFSENPEAMPTLDIETGKAGLINSDGRIISEPNLENVGVTRNGLTYVENGKYSSVVDKYAKALIYGEYDNYCIKGSMMKWPYFDVGKSSFISLKKGKSVYIYDFSKCSGNFGEPDSDAITEDSLFGEYSSFLNNGFYSSMCDILENDVVNAVSHHGHSSRVVAFAKSALKGNTNFIIGKLWDMLPYASANESKLQEELALDYLEHMDYELLEDIISEISKTHGLVKKINTVQDKIKNFDSENSKLRYVQVWKSKLFSENQLYDVITVVGDNQYKLDRFLEETGRAISVVEFVTTYLTICTIQEGIVEKLMELIPKDTDLYVGLERINKQQQSGGYAITALILDTLTDEGLGFVSKILEKGILKMLTGKYASLVGLALDFGCEIIASMIDSPTLQDIEKAAFALANIATLKKATQEYRNTIKNNYEQSGNLSTDEMKANYSLLCSVYFESLIAGLEVAKNVAESDFETETLEKHIDEYGGKLNYQRYMKICLLNAKTQWEYTVQANKAVISKLKAEYPSGEGRISIMYLIEESEDSDLNITDTAGYCIDIPKIIDGYEVVSIGDGAFDCEDRISGVYIPDTVETVQTGSFKSCQNLSTVYLGENVQQIDEQAFENCAGLNYINLPDSVTNISGNAFVGVDNLVIESSSDAVLSNFNNIDNITTQNRDKEIAAVEIQSEPVSKKIEMQDEIDTAGLVLKVIYKDGTSETVEDGFYCEIAERKVGTNTVNVYYSGFTAEYTIEIVQSMCSYVVSYEDECGNKLASDVMGTALSGSELKLVAPEIDGYLPINAQQTEIIGYKNNFVIKYKKQPKKSIANIVVLVSDQYYSNEYLSPDVKVTLEDKTLNKDVDYTVKYDNNLHIGTASVIIIAKGEYEGIVEKTFEIKELKHSFTKYVKNNDATCIKDGTKTALCDNGCGEKDTVIDKNSATGHTFSAWETTKKATYTEAGTQTRTCSICKATETKTIAKLKTTAISKCTSTVTASVVYTGKALKPTVKVKNGSTTLKAGTHYTVKYSDNTKIGKATVKITGVEKNGYSGTKTLNFTIVPAKTSGLKAAAKTSS